MIAVFAAPFFGALVVVIIKTFFSGSYCTHTRFLAGPYVYSEHDFSYSVFKPTRFLRFLLKQSSRFLMIFPVQGNLKVSRQKWFLSGFMAKFMYAGEKTPGNGTRHPPRKRLRKWLYNVWVELTQDKRTEHESVRGKRSR